PGPGGAVPSRGLRPRAYPSGRWPAVVTATLRWRCGAGGGLDGVGSGAGPVSCRGAGAGPRRSPSRRRAGVILAVWTMARRRSWRAGPGTCASASWRPNPRGRRSRSPSRADTSTSPRRRGSGRPPRGGSRSTSGPPGRRSRSRFHRGVPLRRSGRRCRYRGPVDQAKDGGPERDGARGGRAGADFLQLDAAQAPRGGLAGWLAERLRGAIADGRLPTGPRLPATRALAAELGVSRGVVTETYRRLSEGGQISGRGRNGTVVVAAPAPAAPVVPPVRAPGAPASGELFSADPGADVFAALRAAPAR